MIISRIVERENRPMIKNILKKTVSAALLLSTLVTIGCGKDPLNQPPTFYNPQEATLYNPTNDPSDLARTAVDGIRPRIVIKNTFLRVHKEVGVLITDLFGDLVPRVPTDPANFDDVNSFSVAVHQAKLTMDGHNMDNLMKYFVLNYPDAPLKDLKHTISAGGRMTITGKMKQAGLDVGFEMSGPIHATPDGLMQLDPDSVKTLGIPAKGIMDLLGIQTQKLLTLNEQRGLKMVGNSILMYPGRLFPPPIMNGKVVRVETENDKLNMYFDDGTRLARPPLPVPEGTFKNYKHIYGGAIRMIGNEVHENANLMMVDMNQSNPFDFYLAEYYNHAMAGQVKIINRNGALINFMPDYNDIPRLLGRLPEFSSVDQGLGEKVPYNPNSDPKKEKNANWGRQPQAKPVSSYPNNNF
jgi:hypothetical protein